MNKQHGIILANAKAEESKNLMQLRHKVNAAFIIIPLILIIAFAVRIPFLNEPVDRDSGFFAAIGKSMHEGVALYKDVIDNKPPGVFLIFFLLFYFLKPTLFVVNLFVTLWSCSTAVLVYLIAKETLGQKTAFIASFIFAVFSSSPFIEGTKGMVESFMVSFVLIGLLLFINYLKKHNIIFVFFAGLSLGVGFLFKQVALFDFFAVAGCIFLLFIFSKHNFGFKGLLRKNILLMCGFIIPFLVFLVYFYFKGTLADFIFSICTFNFKYTKLFGYSQGNYWAKFCYFNFAMFKKFSFLYLGGIIFIFQAFFSRAKKEKGNNYILLLVVWAICTFLGISLTGRFFPHYYITLMPVISIMMANVVVVSFENITSRKISLVHLSIILCFLLTITNSILKHYKYYFVYSPVEISMNTYLWEPFVEAKAIGYYIKEHTDPKDDLYVWAEEPEIFFYADRKSIDRYWKNTPFIYFSSFFPKAPAEVISSLRSKKPKYVVVDTRHIPAFGQFNEIGDFLEKNYVLEKEFKVIRNNQYGFSLLVLRFRETD